MTFSTDRYIALLVFPASMMKWFNSGKVTIYFNLFLINK